MLAALNYIVSSVWDKSRRRACGGAICWALREAVVGPRPKASIYRRQISAFSRLLQKLIVVRPFLYLRKPAVGSYPDPDESRTRVHDPF
jgi:hypothetical protein